MGQRDPEFHRNDNKQFVRRELGRPLFQEMREILAISGRKRPFSLRLFCFPGVSCIFLDYLWRERLLCRTDYVIGVEKVEGFVIKIDEFLLSHFPRDRCYCHWPTFESFVDDPEMSGRYPFDIVEIDANDSFHKTDSGGNLLLLNAISKFCASQKVYFNRDRQNRKKRELFLTLVTVNLTHPLFGNHFNGEYYDWLVNELQSNPDIDPSTYSPYIEKTDPTEQDIQRLAILVIIIKLLDEIWRYFNASLVKPPIFYRGRVPGAPMGSMAFKCKDALRQHGNGVEQRERKIKALKKAIEMTLGTTFLQDPIS